MEGHNNMENINEAVIGFRFIGGSVIRQLAEAYGEREVPHGVLD